MTRVAIACQGGGSHTAFTAGVLRRLMRSYDHAALRLDDQPCQVVGFSGTSGGAICALLAWYGVLTSATGGKSAPQLLEAFWERNAATAWWDSLLNTSAVSAGRLGQFVALPEVSPYDFATWRSLFLPPPL